MRFFTTKPEEEISSIRRIYQAAFIYMYIYNSYICIILVVAANGRVEHVRPPSCNMGEDISPLH